MIRSVVVATCESFIVLEELKKSTISESRMTTTARAWFSPSSLAIIPNAGSDEAKTSSTLLGLSACKYCFGEVCKTAN